MVNNTCSKCFYFINNKCYIDPPINNEFKSTLPDFWCDRFHLDQEKIKNDPFNTLSENYIYPWNKNNEK